MSVGVRYGCNSRFCNSMSLCYRYISFSRHVNAIVRNRSIGLVFRHGILSYRQTIDLDI